MLIRHSSSSSASLRWLRTTSSECFKPAGEGFLALGLDVLVDPVEIGFALREDEMKSRAACPHSLTQISRIMRSCSRIRLTTLRQQFGQARKTAWHQTKLEKRCHGFLAALLRLLAAAVFLDLFLPRLELSAQDLDLGGDLFEVQSGSSGSSSSSSSSESLTSHRPRSWRVSGSCRRSGRAKPMMTSVMRASSLSTLSNPSGAFHRRREVPQALR
jgi:hypothetical protein